MLSQAYYKGYIEAFKKMKKTLKNFNFNLRLLPY